MSRKRGTSRKHLSRKGRSKQTRAALTKAAKKHFPGIKLAAEKALLAAGLQGVHVHAMAFSVDEGSVLDQCSPPCGPNERCMLSSTGQWICVPLS